MKMNKKLRRVLRVLIFGYYPIYLIGYLVFLLSKIIMSIGYLLTLHPHSAKGCYEDFFNIEFDLKDWL